MIGPFQPPKQLHLGMGMGLGMGGGPIHYTEAQILALVGVTAGVTPGYTGSPGVLGSPGRTQIAGGGIDSGWPQATNNAPWSWTTRAGLETLITNAQGGLAGATGSEANPYVIQNWYPYGFTSGNNDTTPVFHFNDPSASPPYWVKILNVEFGIGAFNGNRCGDIYCNAPTGGGLMVESCSFQCDSALESSAAEAHIQAVNGTLRVNLCKFVGANGGGCIRKTGANAVVEMTDCLVDGTGGWSSAKGMLRNSATGGSITVTRCTFDYGANNNLLVMTSNCAVTLNRVSWNPSQNTACRTLIPTGTATITEAWTSGFTVTDSRFYTGSITADGAFIGDNNGANSQSLQKWSIVHSEFLGRSDFQTSANNRLILLGPGTAAGAEHTKNITFQFCKFSVPQAVKVVAGNEVLEIFHASDVLVEGCWVNSCGEDAFEVVEPYRNNIIRYCGGGEVSGSYIGGNLVDFYGADDIWNAADGNTGGHQAHHLWGACHGDAVVVDSVDGVAVSAIDIDNVAGGFVANPPAANVRLHARGANSFSTVTVAQSLSAAGISFGGRPCLLTRKPVSSTTAPAGAAGGQKVVVVGSAAGWSAGDMFNITLTNGTIHYSIIDSISVSTVTLFDNLPSAASAGAAVERVNAFNAGTISWPQWNSGTSSFDIKTGTDGVVDGM